MRPTKGMGIAIDGVYHLLVPDLVERDVRDFGQHGFCSRRARETARDRSVLRLDGGAGRHALTMNTSALRPPVSRAPGVVRLLQVLTLAGLILSAVIAGLQLRASVAGQGIASPLLVEIARVRLAALPLAALLGAVAGFAGTLAVARARWRAEAFAPAVTWRRRIVWPAGSPMAVRKAARWPQALLVTPLAALGVAAALLVPAGGLAVPVVQQAAWLLGGGLLVLCFPLLVAERLLAAVPPAQLPEAPWLRALAFVAVLAFAAPELLELAAGFRPRLAGRASGRAAGAAAGGDQCRTGRPGSGALLSAAASG